MEKCFSSLGKEPKKKHLMVLLHPIRYMWKSIGEQLEVPYGDILSAEHNEVYDDTRKLSEVLLVWIDKRTCEVSWRKIITVVDERPIESERIAKNIYQFLSRPEIQNEYLFSNHQTGKFQILFLMIIFFVTLGNVTTTSFNLPPPIQPIPPKIKGITAIYSMCTYIIIISA